MGAGANCHPSTCAFHVLPLPVSQPAYTPAASLWPAGMAWPLAPPLLPRVHPPPLCAAPQIESCQQGKRQGRLYVTDGSMPDYLEQQHYPVDAPGGSRLEAGRKPLGAALAAALLSSAAGGATRQLVLAGLTGPPAPPCARPAGMPCGVDSRANAMLPHAVRSSRATNLFHTLKVCVGSRLAGGAAGSQNAPAAAERYPEVAAAASGQRPWPLLTSLHAPPAPRRRARAQEPRPSRCLGPPAAAPTSPPSISRPRWGGWRPPSFLPIIPFRGMKERGGSLTPARGSLPWLSDPTLGQLSGTHPVPARTSPCPSLPAAPPLIQLRHGGLHHPAACHPGRHAVGRRGFVCVCVCVPCC